MKNMSVFQVALLAAFGALAISGILIFALVVSSGAGNAIGPIVIWGTQEQSAFTVVLRQAAENEGRLGQVTYVQKDPATYAEDLTEALANGTGPDIFLLRQDYAVKDGGKIIPIPYEFLSRTQFEDIFVEAGNPYLAQSGVLGIPLIVDPLIMYWNRDLLGGAGLAKPPQYWEEFADVTRAIVKRDDTGSIQKAAVAFGEYQNVDNAKDILSLLVLQAGGSITRRDNTERLIPALSTRTPGSTGQSTESALRFYTEFADPSKVHYTWNRSLARSRTAFSSGDLALYFGFASEARLISRMNPNLNFAASGVPQTRAGTPMNIARVYALAVSRNAKNPQAAMTVASLIADAPIARALSVALGVPSARRDVLSERSEDENVLFEREAIIARSWTDPDPEGTDTVFRAMIEAVTSGAARYAEAIGRADQEMAQLIEP